MKLVKNVFIVSPSQAYREMFELAGWKVVNDMETADLIQFTGGEDVTPLLYNQHKHHTTFNSTARDKMEQLVFKWAVENGKPMAGICRGGQFLNVMCGGSMWQNVNGHAEGGLHDAYDDRHEKRVLRVTSTHHQMMIPGPDAEIVLTAKKAGWMEKMSACSDREQTINAVGVGKDTEACYYKHEDVFCFQPHPEFAGYGNLAAAYFDYIDEFFGLRASF